MLTVYFEGGRATGFVLSQSGKVGQNAGPSLFGQGPLDVVSCVEHLLQTTAITCAADLSCGMGLVDSAPLMCGYSWNADAGGGTEPEWDDGGEADASPGDHADGGGLGNHGDGDVDDLGAPETWADSDPADARDGANDDGSTVLGDD
jgi:hypothetical protein